MKSEKIRLLSRVMLLGKSRCGNLFALFSFLFRCAVAILALLLFRNFNTLICDNAGRVMVAVCVLAVLSSVVLLECLRTVKDRWYNLIKSGYYCPFSELVVAFSFRDVMSSLKSFLLSSCASVVRLILFFFVPFLIFFAGINMVNEGVSIPVLAVLIAGNVLLFFTALLFSYASLSCVSLARSISTGNTKAFFSNLSRLERNAFRIFFFGVTLIGSGTSVRRIAGIIFAETVCKEN